MVELLITALGQHGDGIAEDRERRIFVPFALPGERVEAEISGDRGTLTAVLSPSPDRAEPPCP